MKKQNIRNTSFIMLFILTILFSECGQNNRQGGDTKNSDKLMADATDSAKKYKVTFIEFGSVRCIPCQQMQPVMKSIEMKYSKDVKVDFHDVWTDAGKPFGIKYGIEAIPTQVFLDETGKEYYRHVGFFPEEELVKILQMKGVKAN
jgi:thioredoxin 1